MFLWGNTFSFFLFFYFMMKIGALRKTRTEIWARSNIIENWMAWKEENWIFRILSLLYTASYSNHYRHHFNKFGVLAQAQLGSFSISLFNECCFGTRNNFLQSRDERKEGIFILFFFLFIFFGLFYEFFFLFFLSFFTVIQTNKFYIAKVFLFSDFATKKKTTEKKVLFLLYFLDISVFHCWLLLFLSVNKCVRNWKEGKNYNLGIV